jgi:transmembrane 9 superfamily protein 3
VLVSGFTLNWVAVAYDSAQAIPFGGMVVMVLIWTLASAPLTVVGTAVGRSRVAAAAAQSGKTLPHVNQIPRVIPRRSSWLSPVKLALYGGLIAFTTIFVELYYVLTSFWNYRFYYVYGFLFLIFVMLLLVAACASVVVMYMLLNGEDHKWQWIAFGTGASTGIYVFIESWFFYMTRTRMSGFFMFTFYFGYTSLMCCGIALVCGAVTFSAGKFFVTAIYRQLRLRE